MRHARGRLDREHQQPQSHVLFGAGQQVRQRGNGTFGVHVQGDIQSGPQGAGHHKSAHADHVEGTQLHLVQRAAPGIPQARNAALGVHQEGKAVRLVSTAVDPGCSHPSRHDALPDLGRHGAGGSTGTQLGRGGRSREGVATLMEAGQDPVGGQ